MAWSDRLADYPVADEDDYSARERDELVQWLETLNPSSEDANGITWSPVSDHWADKLASALFEHYDVCRVDDIPAELKIGQLARETGITRPDPDSIADAIAALEDERDDAIALAERILRAAFERESSSTFADLARELHAKFASETGRRLFVSI